MGAIADLMDDEKVIIDGNDSIVIRRYIGGITGGVTLDMTDFPDDHVKAGHPVIYNSSTGVYKPFPVSSGSLGTLPDGYAYVGVVVASRPTKRPMVAVMNNGEVNDKAMAYVLTDAIKTAIKAAVPTLIFAHD